MRIARAGDELVTLDDGGVHAVPRLHGVAARDFDVEVQVAHERKLNGSRGEECRGLARRDEWSAARGGGRPMRRESGAALANT